MNAPARSAPGRLLKSTQAFAESVVTDVAPHVSYKRSELLLATTRLAHWAVTRDLELDLDVVFSEATLHEFIGYGLPSQSDASRGNVRSQLRRIREVLNGGVNVTERLAGAEPLAPYGEEDLARFAEWAQRQKTPAFRRDARSILALALGAGLAAGEICELVREDVLVDEKGVQILVRGQRERVVQVVRNQESRIAKAAAAIEPGQYLIRCDRTSNPKNLISNIVDRGIASELGPQTQRMRATWIVRHLNAGTPVAVLMEAAGLESLKALTRYLPFAEPVVADAARRALRR